MVVRGAGGSVIGVVKGDGGRRYVVGMVLV